MPLVQRARSEESMGLANDTKTATIQLKGIGGTELPIDTVQVPTPTSAVAIRAAVSAALSIPSSSFELVVAGQTVEAASGADFAAAGHTVTVVPSGRSGFELRRDKAPHRRLVPSDPSSSSSAAAEMMGCTAAASGSIETEADLDHVAVMLRRLPRGNDVDGHPKVMVAVHGPSGKPTMVALDPEEALRLIGQMKAEIEASPIGGGGGDGDEPSEAASEPGSLFSDSKYPRAHAPTPTPTPTPAPAPAPTTAASPDEQFRVMQMRYNQMVDAAKSQSKKRSENLRTARAMELIRDKRAAKAARRKRRERQKRAKTAGGPDGAAATSTEPVSATTTTAAATTTATPAATLAATASTAVTTTTVPTAATAEKASATRRLPTSKTLKPARSLFGGFSKGFLN